MKYDGIQMHCVYMACFDGVVCLSSPFHYIDLNSDGMFRIEYLRVYLNKNTTISIINSSDQWVCRTSEKSRCEKRKKIVDVCTLALSLSHDNVGEKKKCQ